MYVQLDRIEDGKWAVLIPYPEGMESFDIPLRLLPPGASSGDVYRMDFELNEVETERVAAESKSLMEGLLGEGQDEDKAERQG